MTVRAAVVIRLEDAGVWLPAFAGMTVGDEMTVGAVAGMGVGCRGVDSRFRGNDGGGSTAQPQFVIDNS